MKSKFIFHASAHLKIPERIINRNWKQKTMINDIFLPDTMNYYFLTTPACKSA